jgi:hypothetical protein
MMNEKQISIDRALLDQKNKTFERQRIYTDREASGVSANFSSYPLAGT